MSCRALMPRSSSICHCCSVVQRVLLAVLMVAAAAVPSFAQAQGAQNGRLIVTVVDTSGAVVPGATVTVGALDDGARAAAFPPMTSTDKGVATLEGLLPGRYRVQGEFPGFEIGVLPEVRVRRGDNKHVLVLPLKKIEESVTVAQNAQAAAADPRGRRFKTVLTRQEIENLSDDRDRDGAAAPGSRRRQRHDPRRQLRRGAAAAKGVDQVDPHRSRRLRSREPFGGVGRHRHHHAARTRGAERRRQLHGFATAL